MKVIFDHNLNWHKHLVVYVAKTFKFLFGARIHLSPVCTSSMSFRPTDIWSSCSFMYTWNFGRYSEESNKINRSFSCFNHTFSFADYGAVGQSFFWWYFLVFCFPLRSFTSGNIGSCQRSFSLSNSGQVPY